MIRIFEKQWKKWLDIVVHVAHGALSGALFTYIPLLSIFLYIQFFLYEFFEETKIRDELYFELREWSTGFILGFLASWLWSLFLT